MNSKIRFEGLRFRYPTRPDVEVLQGLTLEVEPGETVALVGASGCGKSTTVQLVERFYDPEDGIVVREYQDFQGSSTPFGEISAYKPILLYYLLRCGFLAYVRLDNDKNKIQSWGGKTTFRIFTLFMKTKVPAVFELGFVG